MCKHKKRAMSGNTCILINSCTKLSKTKFFLSLNQSKYSLEPKIFLGGLRPLNLLLRGSDPPTWLTLATLPFLLIMFPVGSYDIHPEQKWHLTNLSSRESNIWYPSLTKSVQHFTKRSWNLLSFSFCSEKFLCIMLLIC